VAVAYTYPSQTGSSGPILYLAHDARHDRPVALKVFDPHFGTELGERFLREIRVTAKLGHPHILTVHDSGAADGLLWYTMRVVDGESLRQRIRREGPLPLEEAVRIDPAGRRAGRNPVRVAHAPVLLRGARPLPAEPAALQRGAGRGGVAADRERVRGHARRAVLPRTRPLAAGRD